MVDVSVIVPVYNVEHCLRRCLESICRQTHANIEIICVNDASPDGSQAILDEFAARDPRIVLLRHAENRGLGAARNTGIAAARGEYLAFVDSDDAIEPGMYAAMLRRAREDKVRLVVCGMRLQWPDTPAEAVLAFEGRVAGGREILRQIADVAWQPSKDGRVALPSGVPGTLPIPVAISAWSKLYHRSLFFEDGIRYAEGIYMEDWGASLRALAACDEIVFLPEPYYNYWQSPGSISRGAWNEQGVRSFLAVIEDLRGFFAQIDLDAPTRARILGWHAAWAGRALNGWIDGAKRPEDFLGRSAPALCDQIARAPEFLRHLLGELHAAQHRGVLERCRDWLRTRLRHSPFQAWARLADYRLKGILAAHRRSVGQEGRGATP